MSNRRHVFISHHHADDAGVTAMTSLLRNNNTEVRNSSIRTLRPENQKKFEERRVSEATIQRWLRKKISWASTVVVLIGKETHSRPWVNWEIRQAHLQGKRIVGVYERGGTQNDIPENFERYGCALVNWNANSILEAIDGEDSFQSPDGSERPPVNIGTPTSC